MLLGEIQKLFQKRLIMILFIAVLAGNGLLVYLNAQSGAVSAGAYKALQKDLAGMGDDEKNAYLQEQLEINDALSDIENEASNDDLAQLLGVDSSFFYSSELDYQEMRALYQSGTYPRYTYSLYGDRQLLKEVSEELEQCLGYGDYVQHTMEQALNRLKKTEAGSSYQYLNLGGIYLAFEKMQSVQTSYGPVRGVRMVTENNTTDLWVFFFLLMCGVCCISTEREKNLLLLPKSTRNGRQRLGVCKLVTLLLCAVISMALYLENLGIAAALYGFGDLGRSIQSVQGFNGCTLQVSVGVFLLLLGLGKLLFYMAFAAFIYLLTAFFNQSLWVYGTLALAAGGAGLLYFRISSTSPYLAVKLCSPLGLLQTSDIFGQYKNLDIFGRAINRLPVSLGLMSGILLICGLAGVFVFAKKKERGHEQLRIRIPFLKKAAEALEETVCMLRHELYKVFVTQHVLLILIAAVLWTWYSFSAQRVQMDVQEQYYKQMVELVQGPAADVDEDYWQELAAQYESLKSEALEEDDYQREVAIQEAINAVGVMETWAAYLSEKKDSWYVYVSPYQLLIGSDYSVVNRELYGALLLVCVCVLCFTGINSADYQNDGIRLLRSTKNGRRSLKVHKIAIGVGIGIAVWAMTWLPGCIDVLRYYGRAGMEAPAYSLQECYWLPGWISIGGSLWLLYAVRLLGVLVLMLFTYAVTMRQKSFILSCGVTLFLTLLPVGLALLGVSWMRYVLLTPVLLGNPLLQSPALFTAGLVQMAVIAVWSVMTIRK
jgi:hypothetical protein